MHRHVLLATLMLILALVLVWNLTAAAPAGAPTVRITSPASGATLSVANVEVTFETLDFVVGPIGTRHIHFHLDGDAIPFMFFNGDDPTRFGQQVVLFDFDRTSRATWVSPNTVRFNALANGQHTLSVYLVDGQHNRLSNPEATVTITFTVNVPPEDATPPAALIFVKEVRGPDGMNRRVFDHEPDVVSDLYLLSPVEPGGTVTQLTDVARHGGGVLGPEVSWDGQRVLFSMRQGADDTWHIWEMNIDGTGLRQITFDPPFQQVNDLDPAYLPDGRIIFASDRLKQRDEYNVSISTQLYIVNPDGSDLHLVEPNPSHNLTPQVIRDGRVVFDRWDHLARRNLFTVWHMNQDGTSGFVFFGGASPRGSERLDNAQGIERRELADGEMVGIFTSRNLLPGRMAVFDNRNGNLEDLPRPILLGPEGLYRTPHPLTTSELVYSYSPITDAVQAQFGLYVMPWEPEGVLVDDTTESTAPGPGTNYAFRYYTINLNRPGRIYIEVTGNADDNGAGDDDDAWVIIDGVARKTLERQLDGDLDQGLPRTFRVDADLDAGEHLIQIATDETPTIRRVRIVRAVRAGTPTLLYDDPATNEVSPIPVRPRTPPPVFPSQVDRSLTWGTFMVRDISLRGDFRQPNFRDPEGDPNYNFHLDLSKLRGLRVFQSLPRRGRNKDVLAGGGSFEAVRVLGVVEPNAYGTVVFQTPANRATAWDLIGHDGAAIVHERVWSLVQPGEVRTCGGCHVPPQFPFIQREIGPFPPPTDLRTRGKVYTFIDDVLATFQNRCTTCHLGGAAAGGLDLRGDRASFEALRAQVSGRTPRQYVDPGDARDSFLFQLVTGDARGNASHQDRIDAINAAVDHTSMLTPDETYALATWIDTGAGFAFLPDGERSGPPEAVGILPRPGSADVPQNTGIAVHFNAAIDRATLDEATFQVRGVGGATVTGTWHWGTNRDVLFRPDAPLTPGEYEVTLSGDILDIKDDTVGEPLARPLSVRFTVGDSTDLTPPQVTGWVPDGSPVSISGPVVVHFSEPLAPGSVNDDTVWVEDARGERVAGRVGASADGGEVAFAPYRPFQPGATYTLRVSGTLHDLAGNRLGSDLVHTFTTAAAPAPQYHGLIADRPAGNGPQKVAVRADGSQVLVANASSDTLALYDGTTWELVRTYDNVGDGPHDVAFSPDGTLAFVLSLNSDDVRVLRLSDGALLTTVTDIGNPYLMALNPAGTRLYVTDTGTPDRLHEVDVDPTSPTFGQVVRSLNLSHEPFDVAVSPDGQLAYVSGRGGVAIIDLDLWVERHFLEVRQRSLAEIALSPDGRQAYVADRWQDALHVVDLVTGQHVVALPVGDYPESVAASPDGRFVYVTERSDRTVAVLDTATLQVVRRLSSGARTAEGLAVSPDGRLVYATEGGWPGRLRVFHLGDLSDTTAPQVTGVHPGNNATGVPTFAPLLIDLSEGVDRLTVSEETVQLLHNGVQIHGTLQVSADNRRIWFRPGATLQPGGTYTLRVTTGLKDLAGNSLAGQVQVQFTTAAQPEPPPIGLWATPDAGDNPRGIAITPDGTRVLVTDYWGNRLRIVHTVDWTETTLDLMHRVERIAVSPDSTRAYVARPELNDVVVVDLTTNRAVDLDANSAGLEGIPVGSRPVSLLHHPAQPRLYVVNRDSGDVSVIDTETLQEVARWPVNGVGPEDRDARGIALTPEGTRLLVTSRKRLSVLDANDGRLLHLFDDLPGSNYYGVVVTPDGEQAWLASASSDALVVVDLRVNAIIAQVPVGASPTWLVLSPDGEWVYAANQEAGSVSVVWRRTATVLNTLVSSGRVFDLARSPDGQRLYVPNDVADAVLVYQHADPADRVGPTVTQITPTDADRGISVITPLVVTFNEALDRGSVNGSTFRVTRFTGGGSGAGNWPSAIGREATPQGEVAVSGQYLFSADNRTVTFLPDQPWQPGITYTLRLESGLTDLAGNPLTAPQRSSFRTAVPLAPPAITARAESYASSGPVALALAPDDSLVAVANHHQDSVSLLDPDTLAAVAEIPAGDGPFGLAFSPDSRRLYVVREHEPALVVIDVGSRQVVQVVAGLAAGPQHITLSPDGTKAYITGHNSGGLDEVDLTTGRVTRLVALTNPGRPRFAPDGTLYVPARDRLWRREADGSWRELYVGGGYIPDVAFSADGRHAYLSLAWEDWLQVVDLALGRPVYDLPLGDDPRWLVQSADGRLLLVANETAGTIQVIDTLTHVTLQTVVVPGGQVEALVWDEGRGRLYLGDTNGGRVRSYDLPYRSSWSDCVADLNGDGQVDLSDLQMVVARWRQANSTYDLTGDGWVDVTDVVVAGWYVGQRCP